MKKGVLVIGSINHDTFYRVQDLPRPHETVAATSSLMAPGGKGANQAAACAMATDGPVQMLGCVGKDGQAELCVSYLRSQGVDVSALIALEDVPTGSACVVVDQSGDNLIVVSGGANAHLSAARLEVAVALFEDAAAAVFQLETPIETVERGLEMARAYRVQTVLNPAPYIVGTEALLPLADVLTPNQTEASSLTGLDVMDETGARAAAAKLLELGAKAVVITLGGEGCLVASGEKMRALAAYHVDKVVDTTGAGDVFNGALAAALSDGADLFEAADFASAAAAMSVTKPTAAYCAPTRKAIEAFRTN